MLTKKQYTQNLQILNYKSLTDFQKYYGLERNGIFDMATNKKMVSLVKNNIKFVLSRLTKLPLSDNGIIGEGTVSAINKYKKSINKTPNGICDKDTLNSLFKNSAVEWSKYPKVDVDELECGCDKKLCKGYPCRITTSLIKVINEARRTNKVYLTSGLRCQRYNDLLSGSIQASHHTKGAAMDFYIKDKNGIISAAKSQAIIVAIAKKLKFEYYTYQINDVAVHFQIN